MSKWHERIKVHGDPHKQIGITPDGQPVFTDVRELISSPDEDAERWSKTIDNRRAALIEQVAKLVLRNAGLFIDRTFFEIASQSGRELLLKGDGQAAFQYAVENGIQTIQDGLKTVIKHRGKVIREMDANISASLAPHVAKRVNEIVKSLPSNV